MISIQMYTLRESMKDLAQLDATLAKVAEMGYNSVQITTPGYITPVDLAKLLRSHGLTADSSLCTLYQIPDKIDDACAAAKALGTDVVRTDSIAAADRFSLEGYHKAAEHLNRCGKLLHDRGYKFMYHFHAFEWISLGDTRGMDILLSETDPETVWFQPDVFWLTSAGLEPSAALEKFAGRMQYMHLKDYTVVASGTAVLETTKSASAPVGTGNLCWERILPTAKKLGVTNFVVEDDMGVLDPFESAAISCRNLKAMLG